MRLRAGDLSRCPADASSDGAKVDCLQAEAAHEARVRVHLHRGDGSAPCIARFAGQTWLDMNLEHKRPTSGTGGGGGATWRLSAPAAAATAAR